MQQFSSEQQSFIKARLKLRSALRGKENVSNFAERLGVSIGTMYGYLAGRIPDTANSKMIVDIAKKEGHI